MNIEKLIEDDNKLQFLNRFLDRCCEDFDVTPDELIEHLFTDNDLLDLVDGYIPERTLIAHIAAWIEGDKQKVN